MVTFRNHDLNRRLTLLSKPISGCTAWKLKPARAAMPPSSLTPPLTDAARGRLDTFATHVAPSSSAAGAPVPTNMPRGDQLQGWGRLATAQPPVFDPSTEHEAARRFFEANSFVAIKVVLLPVLCAPLPGHA